MRAERAVPAAWGVGMRLERVVSFASCGEVLV
jgi:hypothetical protein